ncbi:MAG: IS110 family transposase, partial [Magnetococcus sp. DMHC-8]
MNKNSVNAAIRVLGIDIGKNLFHLHGVTESGRVGLRRQVQRDELLPLLANMPPCLIGMEACGGAHQWGRKLRELGHEVKLMAPQFVKPYVKGNKHDFNDAEAICEAVQRPNMRFVAVKSVDQQEILAWHRARSLAVGQRTAEINQIRGLLMEFGVVLPTGARHVRERLPAILDDEGQELAAGVRQLLRELFEALQQLDARILEYDRQIAAKSRQTERCRLLMTIPGIGVLTASALVASIGDPGTFRDGREVAAWLGLTPRQHSTGGKT